MKITEAQYVKSPINEKDIMIKALVDGEEAWIPLDPANRHYIAIQKWVTEGNAIEDAD